MCRVFPLTCNLRKILIDTNKLILEGRAIWDSIVDNSNVLNHLQNSTWIFLIVLLEKTAFLSQMDAVALDQPAMKRLPSIGFFQTCSLLWTELSSS